MKLQVFVGSSSESLNVANAIKHLLDSDDVECTVWDKESFFRLSHSTIETLSAAVDRFDAGIFVFGEDDKVSSRGVNFSAPRDNVIFEHGLFCGHLGAKRTFVVRAKSRELKWLSDLEGFLPAQYDETLARTNAEASVKTACELIRTELRLLPAAPGSMLMENGNGLDPTGGPTAALRLPVRLLIRRVSKSSRRTTLGYGSRAMTT